MTDHLPECHTAMIPDFHNERWICICHQLRACEQRVNSSNLTMWDRTQEQAQQMVTSGLGIAWKDGFKEGINVAREAVAEQKLVPLAKQGRFIITRNTKLWKQRQAWSELGWWDFRTSALAAIDALRENND